MIGGVWSDADPTTTAVDPQLAFVIDLRGFPAGSDQAILDAFAAWEIETAGDLFDEAGTTFADANVAFGDGVNTYSMRNLGSNALAATFITWNDADENGKIDTGETFLEMDIVHNFTVSWDTDESPNPRGKYWDVKGVATHEIGHADGLGHPGNAHTEDKRQTMYYAIASKDLSKRSLEADGDIPGIRSALLGYGAP